MKTRLTLSTVVFAMLLTPAAFANGAQEQTQEAAVESTRASVVVVTAEQPAAPVVSRSVLERLQQEVREEVLGNLRDSGILADMLQLAAPALVEAVRSDKSLTAL